MNIDYPEMIGEAEAERFLEDPSHQTIHYASHIDRKGAEVLLKHKGLLNLNGIRFLSDEVAEILGRHIGKIEMNGMVEINVFQAKSLCCVHGGLGLNGIKLISQEVAVHLSETRGELSLNGLESIDFEAFKILMEHRSYLRLCGLKFLPDDLYEGAQEFSGLELSLDGLTRRIPCLLPYEGQLFSFKGIKEFSDDDIFQIQCFSEGRFVFDGVSWLDPASLRRISQAGCEISLMGLEMVSDNLLFDLIACPNISFQSRWRVPGDVEESCRRHGEIFFWHGGCMFAIDAGAILVGIEDGIPEYTNLLITCKKFMQGEPPEIGESIKNKNKSYKLEELAVFNELQDEIKFYVC